MNVTEFLALKKGYALAMLEQQGALGPANYGRDPNMIYRKGLPWGENADGWVGNSPAQMQHDAVIAELKNEMMQRNRRR